LKETQWFVNVIIFILAIGAVTGGYFLGRGHWNVGGAAASKFTCPTRVPRFPGMTSNASACHSMARPRAQPRRRSRSSNFPTFSAPSAAACSHARQAAEGLPGQGAGLLQAQPVAVPLGRDPGGAGCRRSRAAGQVLADARQAVCKSAEPEEARPGKVRQGNRLDVEKFKKDMDSPAVKKRVDDDLELAKKLGVQGTPNFFINGRPSVAPCPSNSSSPPSTTSWPVARS